MTRAFQKPKRLICDLETLSPTYGHFFAQPFERGFGTTIGNALRRVLLSSIEGAAITAVKIEGVLHEFTPIPNVTEDATNIIMNLKQVPLKLNVDHTKTIYLESEQAGEITAANITRIRISRFSIRTSTLLRLVKGESSRLRCESRRVAATFRRTRILRKIYRSDIFPSTAFIPRSNASITRWRCG